LIVLAWIILVLMGIEIIGSPFLVNKTSTLSPIKALTSLMATILIAAFTALYIFS